MHFPRTHFCTILDGVQMHENNSKTFATAANSVAAKAKTANLRQENIIYCRKTPEQLFLPAAKPTGQGEESVVLLGMVGDVGGTTFKFLMYTLWGEFREKFFFEKGCIQRKLLFEKGCIQRKNLS